MENQLSSESTELDLKLMEKTLEFYASNRQAFGRDFKISVVNVRDVCVKL